MIGLQCDDLEYVLLVEKVILVLNLIPVFQSKVPYYLSGLQLITAALIFKC